MIPRKVRSPLSRSSGPEIPEVLKIREEQMMWKRGFAPAELFLLAGTCLFSQSSTSLNGLVTDPSGGVVRKAEVILIKTDTGAKRSTVSGSNGRYTFAQVTPGSYRVIGQAVDFSVETISGLELLVNSPATFNIALEIGQLTETVNVNAGPALLNTTDASLGNAIDTHAILQLPLEARNPASLLALQAGVTYFGTDNVSSKRLNGSVNGSKPDQNNITLDGADVNDQNTRSPLTSVLRVPRNRSGSTSIQPASTLAPQAHSGNIPVC